MTTHFLPKTGRILKTLLKFDCLLHISRFELIFKRLTPSMKHVIRKCIVVFSPLPPSLFLKLKHYSFQSPTFFNTPRVDAHVSTRAVHGRIEKLYFARRRPQRKHFLKREFTFFQSSSQLFEINYCVNCRRALLEMNSYQQYPRWRQGYVQNTHYTCKIVVSIIKPIAFLTSPLSLQKDPKKKVPRGGLGWLGRPGQLWRQDWLG